MATDLIFNDNFINKYGGKLWFYQRNDGTDSWHIGVGRIKSDSEFGQESTPIIWEDGNQGPSQDDTVKTIFTLTSPDDSLELEKFLKEDTVNQTFHVVIPGGTYGDANGAIMQKVRVIAEAKINRKYKSGAPGREVPIEIIPQYNATSYTMTSASSLSAYLGALTATVVPVGMYYSLSAIAASASQL